MTADAIPPLPCCDCPDRPPKQFVSERCLCCGYRGLGNLGETQQSQAVARVPWMPVKMELLLSKGFLEPASPLQKHIFNQKPPLFLFLLSLLVHLLIPTLLWLFASILKFWYPVLVLGWQPLASSQSWHVLGKCKPMKQHGNVNASLGAQRQLKPSPDKIQGAFTVMKFFSKNCCLFGAAVQWLFFQ